MIQLSLAIARRTEQGGRLVALASTYVVVVHGERDAIGPATGLTVWHPIAG